jgi:tRNA (guanine37-N1)-methyltransferase
VRIDILTIFPEFFDVLDVSLLGKARDDGTLDTCVHDLRAWTTDRHQTVDDTPFGGGAGMVMKPDVWGVALDDVLGAGEAKPVLVVPTPSGDLFTQAEAAPACCCSPDWFSRAAVTKESTPE